MRYTTIIFDIDGTLVDSRESVLYAADAVRRSFCGRPATAFELEYAMAAANAESFLGFPQSMQAALNDAAQRAYLEKPSRLYEGAEALIRRARGQGLTLCVLTSRMACELEAEACFAPILGCFSYFIFADSGFSLKPSAAPALELLRLCGAKPEQTLYAGDSQTDMLCAKNAGIPFALATWGSRNDMPAQFKPRDMAALSKLIFGD